MQTWLPFRALATAALSLELASKMVMFGVRTELCGNFGGITDDTVDLHSWIIGHEVRGDELAQTRMIDQYVIHKSISISHGQTIRMLLSFEFCSLDFWDRGQQDWHTGL